MTYYVLEGSGQCEDCGPFIGTMYTDGEADDVCGVTMDDLIEAGVGHPGCGCASQDISDAEARERAGGAGEGTDAFSADMLEAMRDYQIASSGVNALLRTGRNVFSAVPEAQHRALAANLTDAFRVASPLRGDTVLYRGVDGAMARRLETAALNGRTFVDKGFMSTTGTRSVADDFARYAGPKGRTVEIHVPAGTRTLQIDKLVGDLQSDEFLLPAGTRFSVRFAANKLDMILEVIP